MGAAVNVGGTSAQFTNVYSSYANAYVSMDGTNWTSVADVSGEARQSFSPVSARYVEFVFAGSGPDVTDTRVYDSDGNPILGPSSAPPAAPTSLSATSGNRFISLSWAAPEGAGLSYNVYRGVSAGGEGATAIATGVSATNYTDSGLTNGMTYYYTVAAVNGAGAGPTCGEISATPQAIASVAPTGLTATFGNAQVVLAWSGVNGATGYSVYRGTSPGGEGAPPVASGLTATGYTDTGLTNGTTYYYTVRATNDAGASDPSNEASATPEPPPATPGGLSAVAVSANQINLSWATSAGATGYQLERSLDGNSDWAQVAALAAASYQNIGLSAGTPYYYRVRATNQYGVSAYGDTVSAVTDAAESSVNPRVPQGGSTTFSVTPNAFMFYPGYGYNYGGSSGSRFWQIRNPQGIVVAEQNYPGNPYPVDGWNVSSTGPGGGYNNYYRTFSN